jgi:hypothetical protein
MEFTHPETKKTFRPTVEKDRKVHVPRSDKHGEYSGPMSMIPPDVAESMISQGVPFLEKIASPAKPAVVGPDKDPK